MLLLIVDGYNAIHAWPGLREALREGDAGEARRRLVAALAEYRATTGTEVTVVFDAGGGVRPGAVPVGAAARRLDRAAPDRRGEPEEVDGVTVRYGTPGSSADHIIERMASASVRRSGHPVVTVASSDRLVRDMVSGMGVATMSSQALVAEVTRARGEAEVPGRVGGRAAAHRRLEDRLSPAVRARLEAMRRGEER